MLRADRLAGGPRRTYIRCTMLCPNCATEMDQHVRHGVTIDHCPACGGVWLDKGELDHMMAAVRPAVTLRDPSPEPAPQPPRPKPAVSHGARYTPRKPAKPERAEDTAPRRKPARAQRYKKRYSNRARFKDILEEIFDFD